MLGEEIKAAMPELAMEIDKVVENPELEAIEGNSGEKMNGQVTGENTEKGATNGRT